MMNFTVCILHLMFLVIRSRKMRWAEHLARMEAGKVFAIFWLGGPKIRDHWEELDVVGKITLS
jgi:hypothetical protein